MNMNIVWLFDLYVIYGKLMQFIISTVLIPIKVLNHAKCLQCRPLRLCLLLFRVYHINTIVVSP